MAETAVIAAIAAKTGASAATVVAVGAAATAAVASIAISSVQAKKAEADSRKDSARAPRDITVRSAIEPARIIYGEARTSGPVVYTNTASTPGTTDNSTLWTVISLCNHEVEDITDVWLDGDKILANQIVGGNVTSGKYGPIGSNYITNIYKRYGTSTQTHVTQLADAFTDWTSAYDGRGVAYIVTGFELGTATGEGVWSQGAPQNIRAVVKGKKVYDPRKDSTNGGSGTHRLADPTTWEWSDNPALCVADYLFDDRLGMGAEGITYNEIDWAMVTTAANVCDATVTSPAGNQKRFTCNGALSTGETYAENIKQLLSSMAGSLTWSGGKFRIRALAYEAPTYTFTGDDVIGDVQIQPETSRAQRFNLVRGTFIDPASDYVATEFIPVESTTFRDDRDGGQTLNKQIKLPFTNNEYMAQRIAYKQLNVADQQLRCVVPMNYKAMKVAVGDRIQLSIDELSWTNKPFLVEGWVFSPNGGYELTLQEESSSAYADPALGDYSTRTWAGDVVFPDPDVPAPSGLAATNEQEAVLLSWDAPSRPSAYDEVVVYASSSSAWSGASEIGRTRGTTFRHEVDIVPATYPTSATFYYWVRAVDIQGEESIRNPNSDTSSVQGIAQKISTNNLSDDANFALTADWPSITDSNGTRPEDNATYNTGALADKDTVGEADIDNGAVTIDKFGTGLEPVQVVSSLPGTATAGQMAFLTTDNKLYRYNGTAWTAAVPVGDVTGAGDLAALDTITLTYVTDAGDVAALDSISETYIDDDSITTVKINAQAVTAAKIQANTITAAQIAANTITANEIAANTITANQIAANTITTNEIAANTITAGEIAAGTITADELAANAVTGQVFDASSYLKAGSGDNSAVMSGRSVDEYAFWAGKGFETDGGPSGADAPFRVTRDGKVIMTNFALYSEAGTKLFDSQDGLLALPQTAVAQASGSLVPQVSEELTSGTDTFTVTLSSTQTITANFAYPVGALYYSGTSLTDAQNNVSSAFGVTLQYSSDSGSTWNTFGSTQNFSKVTSGTPTSSQYLVIANSFTVSIIYGATPTTVYVASLQSNRGAIDEGMTLVGSTSQSLAAGTYLVRMVFSATGGSGTGAPATDKTREIRLTTSGAGFTVSDGTVSDGVGTSATTGWVTSNFQGKDSSGNVVISGNLTVNGTTTTINSTTLSVDDKNIVLADGAANAAAADGAGITIDGASATFTYDATNDLFESNKVIRSQNWVYLESAGTGQEAGIRFDEAGSARWYVYKDNSNDSAFHIQSAGAAGEGDSTPRLRMSRTVRESYFGGSLAVGKYSITSGYSLDVSGSTIVGGNLELGSGSSTGVLKLKTYDDAASEWHLYNYNDDTFRINYNGSGGDEIILNSSGLLTVSGGITTAGNVSLNSAGHAYLNINGASGSESGIIWKKGSTNKWETYVPGGTDNLQHYSYTLPGQVFTLNANGLVDIPSGYLRILNTGTDQKIQFQRDSSDTISIEHDSSQFYFWNRTDSHYTFKMTHEGLADARLGFQVNGTTVIDSGRDLKNIGVIESTSFRTKTNGVTYWGSASTDYGHLTWDTGYAEVRALNSGELRLGSTYSGNVVAIDTAGYLESRGNGIKMSTRYLARPSNWGYSTGYKAIILGSASTTYGDTPSGSVTLAFNYDPSVNANGSFTGDGREIVFRNGTQFVTPNSANTAWNNYNLVLKDGHVGIGVSNPQNTLSIDSSYTNSVMIQGAGSYNLYSYHDAGGVGWATGPGSSYDTLIYMQGQNNYIRLYTGGDERLRVQDTGANIISGGLLINGTEVISSARNLTSINTASITQANLNKYRLNDVYASVTLSTPYFTNGVSNQAVDITLGNVQLNTEIQIEVTGGYSYQNVSGVIRRKWQLGFNANNGVWQSPTIIDETIEGPIASVLYVSDPFWDSGASTYKIRIYKANSYGNSFQVRLTNFSANAANNFLDNVSMGSLLTSTTTSSTHSAGYNVRSGYRVGTTSVIDSSRNLENIGSITASGTIATTGSLSVNDNASGNYYLFLKKPASGDGHLLFQEGSGLRWQNIATSGSAAINWYSYTASATTFQLQDSGGANLIVGDYKINGTSVITSGRDITNVGTATMNKLNLHAGSYQGVLTFGSAAGWRTGISQFDNGDAEMRIWHRNTEGMIFLTTGYDGEAATLARPTAGLVVQQNNVGIGNFSSSNPANYLHVKGTGDAQLTLDGDGTTWSGIRFQDGNGGNYLWMYGGTSTWAFGGGGSAVSGKRVHIDGGCTIGDTYDSATMPTNGLQVEGEIFADKGIRVAYSGDNSVDAGVYIANTSSDWGLRVNKGSYEYGIRNDTPSTSSYAYYQEAAGVTRIRFDGAGNSIFAGNVTAYGSPSDIRLKENVERIPDAVEKVKKLDGITFNYKEDGGRSTGLIAQQLLEVLPEVVYTQKGMDGEGEERYAVRYGNVVGLLVEAIKEQQTQIEALQTQLEELKNGDH